MKKRSRAEILILVLIMSFLFSFSLGLLMLWFHEFVLDASEAGAPPFVLHWLRDSSLGFGVAIPVSLVAFPISQIIVRLSDRSASREKLDLAITIITMCLMLSAALTYVLIQFHQLGLHAEEARELRLILHWLRDSSIGFGLAIPIALIAFPLSERVVEKVLGRSRPEG
jgi:hypothetical protein